MSRSQTSQPQNEPEQERASPVLLASLGVANLLSFSELHEVSLSPLNVLIGSNGSGKSNFIEAIALLRSTATDIASAIRRGGGVQEWIWKGKPDELAGVMARIYYPDKQPFLVHFIAFFEEQQAFTLSQEIIRRSDKEGAQHIYFDLQAERSKPLQPLRLTLQGGLSSLGTNLTYSADRSILTQLRDPVNHPQITYLADQYQKIRIYREWSFGRNTVFRTPQSADMRTDRLEEDFSNLGLFLNRLRRDPKTKRTILERLRDIYAGVDDFDVSVEGGTVQVFLTEGDFTIPATRLSDGTLRYLCLLAILCDPKPPPLICIEEPELGLHPDILPKIADLLVEASQRTQLIVTTHSDILVDAMTERPEAILVCEKQEGRTQIKRLDREDLSQWLEKYRLGELWMRGDLGGTRW